MGRINKVIELLEQGQPAYSTPAPELTYESGLEASQTWADLLLVEFEHFAFDIKGLTDFMRGLKDGGPTPSGHGTPTVVASLPSNCRTRDEVIYNAWQTRHVLSTGAHGINHTHARDPEAVKAYVATARYPFHKIGRDLGIPEGMRGGGGQSRARCDMGHQPGGIRAQGRAVAAEPRGRASAGAQDRGPSRAAERRRHRRDARDILRRVGAGRHVDVLRRPRAARGAVSS